MSIMPKFFIVGAARSGTTSFNRYLSQHPEIYITPRKEVHFFAADHFPYNGPGDEALNRRVIRDEQEYGRLFACETGKKAIGESSVFYLCFPDAAERIAQAVPDAKIIMLLREPVERAYSAYMLLVRDGRETLGFAEGLSREEERRQKGFEPMWWYRNLGLYSSQVRHYLDIFGRERVKVLLYDELCVNPGQVLREVFAFLGVKEDVTINTSVHYNVAGIPRSRRLYALLSSVAYKSGAKQVMPGIVWKAIGMFLHSRPTLDPDIHAQLKASFAGDIDRLQDLLQSDLRHWHYQEPENMKIGT